jgi:uncharacterized OsmC-like protein
VLVVSRVHVKYGLLVDALDDEVRQKIDRCMEFHPRKCPVARTLEGAIDISTEIEVGEADAGRLD